MQTQPLSSIWLAVAPKFGHNRWTQDRVKLLQSPYVFRLLCPPSPLPTGILYSAQFRSRQETKMAPRRTQRNNRHLRSHGKIGDCEQSISFLRSISLVSLFTSLSIFGWSDLLQILRRQAAFSFAVLTIIVFNRPFAGSGHMVRNKLHWDGNDAVGL